LLLPPGIVGERSGGLVAFRPFYVNGPPYGGLVGDVHDAARFLTNYPMERLTAAVLASGVGRHQPAGE